MRNRIAAGIAILLTCVLARPAFAQASNTVNVSEFVTHPVARKIRNLVRDDEASHPTKINSPRPQTASLSQSLVRAWKRDFIEDGIEETKNSLLQCQRETSVVLTTPLMRSDAQQAHCSRF
jgi:hypothetical protein